MPLKRFIICLITLFWTLPLVSFANNSKIPPYRIRTIVIDPGHGGDLHGASGKYSREQDVTLKVAMLLGKAIEESMKDVKVIYTRTRDMQFSTVLSQDLKERINIANRAKADLFIAIHCNSMPGDRVIVGHRKNSKGKSVPIYATRDNTTTKGTETFLSGSKRLGAQDAVIKEYGEFSEDDSKDDEPASANSDEMNIMLSLMKNNFRLQGIQLATLIQEEYIATGRISRGVKEQDIAVLRNAAMPAVLTEIGFISNPEEEDYINSDAGQQEIVGCILKAIQAYKKQVDAE
jgi:N-acetylmuramoyl-L-alanine amidase